MRRIEGQRTKERRVKGSVKWERMPSVAINEL